LKPGGLFIFSTPNRVAAGLKRGEKPLNSHHVREWSLLELDRLVRAKFSRIQYFGQRIRSGHKLSIMYWRSRWKRLWGMMDFTPIESSDRVLAELENSSLWQPQYFLGVGRK
jgi:hypothetical protein